MAISVVKKGQFREVISVLKKAQFRSGYWRD